MWNSVYSLLKWKSYLALNKQKQHINTWTLRCRKPGSYKNVSGNEDLKKKMVLMMFLTQSRTAVMGIAEIKYKKS